MSSRAILSQYSHGMIFFKSLKFSKTNKFADCSLTNVVPFLHIQRIRLVIVMGRGMTDRIMAIFVHAAWLCKQHLGIWSMFNWNNSESCLLCFTYLHCRRVLAQLLGQASKGPEGDKMSLKCQNCQAGYEMGEKFCAGCGKPLSPAYEDYLPINVNPGYICSHVLVASVWMLIWLLDLWFF